MEADHEFSTQTLPLPQLAWVRPLPAQLTSRALLTGGGPGLCPSPVGLDLTPARHAAPWAGNEGANPQIRGYAALDVWEPPQHAQGVSHHLRLWPPGPVRSSSFGGPPHGSPWDFNPSGGHAARPGRPGKGRPN